MIRRGADGLGFPFHGDIQRLGGLMLEGAGDNLKARARVSSDQILKRPADLTNWDGLIHWYLEYKESNPEVSRDQYLQSWKNAAKAALP